MKPFDYKNVPRCAIDYPLEITSAEKDFDFLGAVVFARKSPQPFTPTP